MSQRQSAEKVRLDNAKPHVERALWEIVELPDSLERDAILADLQGALTKIVRLAQSLHNDGEVSAP